MTEIAYFESQDGPLAYRDTGPRDGGDKVVVLLHSGFVDGSQFDELTPRLTALGYRVIAPDARGHGSSANASRAFRQTDDLAALLAHLELRQVVLAGVSMGGMIGIDTALEYPELVRALVVSGRGLCEPDLSEPWAAQVAEAQISALAAGDLPGYLDEFARWIAGPERELADIDPALVAKVKEMALGTMLKHTPDEPNHLVLVPDVATRVKGITIPVLAINGAVDHPALLATADAFTNAVPGARTVLLEGVGHYTGQEDPAAFTRVLAEFLGEVYAS